MRDRHEEQERRRKLQEASETYHNAFAREIAESTIEIIRVELEGIVEAVIKEVALKSASPFEDGKVWFTVKELKARWNCSNNFICSFPDLEPVYLGRQ